MREVESTDIRTRNAAAVFVLASAHTLQGHLKTQVLLTLAQ